MTTINSVLNLDDLSVQLPSNELEKYIQANFGQGDSQQEMQQNPTMSGIQPSSQGMMQNSNVASPMFSSAALAPPIGSTQNIQPAQPYVEIVEEPQARGLRFRYECEGRSAGSIPGEHSNNEKKLYPTIKIRNYKGPAIVVVSCVTKDVANCKPHPHSLVGKDCRKGVCTVKVKDTDTVTFPHLGIQCAKKKDVANCLKLRKDINVDPFQTGFTHGIGQVDLNVVRLCFQVFLPDANGKITRVVPPVVSQAIHDKKSVNELTICRVDRSSGKAKGGDEMFLLCEKVNKDDIQICFYQETQNGTRIWEDYGDFGQGDVHRQYAIVFKSPAYKEAFIQQPIDVMLQLKRPSDNETSESIPFTYMPEDPDPDRIEEKRKRKAPNFVHNWTASGNPGSIKEGLRSKLKANRRIKQEEPMAQDGLPMYSLSNTGASTAAAASMTDTPTMNFRTADNTTMGSMTVVSTSVASNAIFQGLRFDHTGNNVIDITSAPLSQQVMVGQTFDPNTLDMDLLQEYIQDVSQLGVGGGDLTANLLENGYDPNIAAMESVSSNVGTPLSASQPGTFAATQESLQNVVDIS